MPGASVTQSIILFNFVPSIIQYHSDGALWETFENYHFLASK